MNKLKWSALEYEERERSADWFWALGVIVIASSLTAIIYSNYFFAVLIILSGTLLGFFAKKKPDVVTYELNDKGLKIRSRLYPYENIISFWIQKYETAHGDIKFILFIKSSRAFMPMITIPLENNMAEEIHSSMISKNVMEEEMKEHPSEKIIEFLGF